MSAAPGVPSQAMTDRGAYTYIAVFSSASAHENAIDFPIGSLVQEHLLRVAFQHVTLNP